MTNSGHLPSASPSDSAVVTPLAFAIGLARRMIPERHATDESTYIHNTTTNVHDNIRSCMMSLLDDVVLDGEVTCVDP